MDNFNMSSSETSPGRTYRYYTGTPLFPFGFGLSYTTFSFFCKSPSILQFNCMITNTGDYNGDQVIFVYHSVGEDIKNSVPHPVPLKSLINFERISVNINDSAALSFSFEKDVLFLNNQDGESVLYSGTHFLSFSMGDLMAGS